MVIARMLVAVSTLFVLACTPPRLGPGEISNSQLITEDEIVASRGSNAFEVIQKLRANFLTYRGETSLSKGQSTPYPKVYVDGQDFGEINTLRSIPAAQIGSIRLFRAWEATSKFGTGNMSGVILVTTRQ